MACFATFSKSLQAKEHQKLFEAPSTICDAPKVCFAFMHSCGVSLAAFINKLNGFWDERKWLALNVGARADLNTFSWLQSRSLNLILWWQPLQTLNSVPTYKIYQFGKQHHSKIIPSSQFKQAGGTYQFRTVLCALFIHQPHSDAHETNETTFHRTYTWRERD